MAAVVRVEPAGAAAGGSSESKAQALFIVSHGGPEQLQVRDIPMPIAGPAQVLVKVMACGVNFADIMARQGWYPSAPKTPCVVGYECSGVVLAVGEGVTKLAVGDRVFCFKSFEIQATHVVIDEDYCFKLLPTTSFAEGACIPVTYLTAYIMLFRVGHVELGSTVLVHSAAGGVGLAACQLCKAVGGVTVIGTCSASKHAAAKAHGATHCIDYRTQDYVAEVNRLTDGKGCDVVLDSLGGDDVAKNQTLVGPLGVHVIYGAANIMSGEKLGVFNALKQLWNTPKMNPMDLLGGNQAVAGVDLGKLVHNKPKIAKAMVELLRLYYAGHIKPVLDGCYSFANAGDAHARLINRANVGKVVLLPPGVTEAEARAVPDAVAAVDSTESSTAGAPAAVAETGPRDDTK